MSTSEESQPNQAAQKKKKAKSHSKGSVVRWFVAIELPANIRRQLVGICRGVIGLTWLPEAQINLMVRFIGETRPGVEQRLKTALRRVNCRPMTINLHSVGCFPPSGAPKVLWSGVQGAAMELQDLHKAVEESLESAGVRKENRHFRPHVALGRSKSASRKSVQTWQQEYGSFKTSEFRLTHFGLYSSMITPRGTKNKLVAEYRLQASYV